MCSLIFRVKLRIHEEPTKPSIRFLPSALLASQAIQRITGAERKKKKWAWIEEKRANAPRRWEKWWISSGPRRAHPRSYSEPLAARSSRRRPTSTPPPSLLETFLPLISRACSPPLLPTRSSKWREWIKEKNGEEKTRARAPWGRGRGLRRRRRRPEHQFPIFLGGEVNRASETSIGWVNDQCLV